MESVTSQKYHAIIVGGGTSGLVAGARLSEDQTKNILVIDAGVDRRGDPTIDTPGLISQLWGNPDYDWNYWSQPQEHVDGREIPQPRGRVLGGSSAINVTAMAYPSPKNFDSWAKFGNKGWTYDDMAPYYKKLEAYTPPSQETNVLLEVDSRFDSKLHGTDGPLSTTFPDAYNPFNKAWLHAFDTAGFTGTSDPILGMHQGAFTPPNSVDAKTHQRSYAASAYYNSDIEKRDNIYLVTETFVNRVLLEPSDNGILKATGVEMTGPSGNIVCVYADEVILAAGAFQSPVLLENSGIGSREILNHHGIKVLIDNPGVGENLQDHFFTTVSFEVADDQISADIARDPAVVEALLKQYADSRSGPLSGVPFSLAFTPPVDFHGVMSQEDVHTLVGKDITKASGVFPQGLEAQHEEIRNLLLDPAESCCFYGLMSSQMHVKPTGRTSMTQAYSQQRQENFITIMVGLNHPFSRGSSHTGGRDPKLHPVIDPKYLSHPLDLEILARGTQFIEHLVSQPSLQKMLKGKIGAFLPDYASNLEKLEVAERVVKERLWTTYHPSCTCAMMPKEMGGVVNDRLVVHGTSNLRIIDASIYPMIPMGNIQATVYAVAEKASDIIKEDWAAKE
ncbi:choline dehydrogenase [Mariannaea sp. PMI_226]|nr:choline dehydrogenase [Mariannaea sp. PMI_226]